MVVAEVPRKDGFALQPVVLARVAGTADSDMREVSLPPAGGELRQNLFQRRHAPFSGASIQPFQSCVNGGSQEGLDADLFTGDPIDVPEPILERAGLEGGKTRMGRRLGVPPWLHCGEILPWSVVHRRAMC